MTARSNDSSKIWDDIKGLKRLWPFLKQSKKRLIIAVTMIPIITLLQTSMPLLVKWIIDQGVTAKNLSNLKFGVLGALVIIVAEYLFRGVQSLLAAKSVHLMIRDMRNHLIDHVLRLSARFHDKNMSGALVTRATSDFDNLSDALNLGVLNSVVDFSVLVGAIVGLFVLNWQLALCAVAMMPLVIFIINRCSRLLKTTMLAARAKIATLNAFTQECFYNTATIKLLTGEKQATERVGKLSLEYRYAQMKSVVIDAGLFAVLDGISSITIGVILWYAVSQIYSATDSALTVGVMIAFVQYIQNLFEPLKQLGNKIAMLQGAFTSLDRIFYVLGQKEFIGGNDELDQSFQNIEVKELSFSYNEDNDPVLKNVNFTLEKGKSLALVGRTGSGKSTIIKLLSKIYDGYSGKVFFDKQDLANIDPLSLREQIAIVPQDIVLFDGTIGFNISLGDPQYSEEQVKAAAKIVGLDSYVSSLEDGYNFKVKEDGGNLSIGQKQLIVFARALIKKPKLIILDEATSSIDPASERLIQTAIDRILKDQTVIVIAHRLSTIQSCDEIIYLSYGEIKEKGSHEELIAEEGLYFDLYQAGTS